MARHRTPDWVPEKLQHLGWAAWFLAVGCLVMGVVCGFVCCVGWRIGG